MTYVLRSKTADGLPLWFDEGGPTIQRSQAKAYRDAKEAERGCRHFAYVFDLEVEAVEVGSALDLEPG
jgi:hypothetical protein